LGEKTEDFRLLKAYDRVFWLRYNHVTNSETIELELKKTLIQRFHSANVCFFTDPSLTPTRYQKVNVPVEEEELDMV